MLLSNDQSLTLMTNKIVLTTQGISRRFFDLDVSQKSKVGMTSDYPYGYEKAEILSQSLTGEGITPDPKETYNIKVSL